MNDHITIRIGGVELRVGAADAASIAAQLASAGVMAAPVTANTPDGVMVIGDEHPMWEIHSGGSRHDGPDWGPDDRPLAESQDRLPRLTRIFHDALVDHPGQLLSVEDLARVTGDELASSRVIAGALSGYVQWCERLDRRFPFYWWEGRDGSSTRYAMQPRVATLFAAARRAKGL